MTQEREYFHNLNHIRDKDPVNSYYDIDQEDVDEYSESSVAGCVWALLSIASVISTVLFLIF